MQVISICILNLEKMISVLQKKQDSIRVEKVNIDSSHKFYQNDTKHSHNKPLPLMLCSINNN